ncbi:hypothetical protein CAOG_08237 [Capsaspora owczarzaki ATCC 30864]|uniref:Conserved oligomeric Golgi complex subunit 2 n=1 Tax=Capsaspora owczarzaki (strain ATCC 30864) TaxID=595528 RepID=A0A0D2X5R0_CAPO3|nr:hypothetical protein CAOG_08237 [Capsaspora owczarzaki ATCC 30864]KJE98244.1 hypothetical protein CAOG_008237 [Capsaspora owczarzaki ATCC 30864]|eukprot:XP_004342492.2 hypothetical protein CAOG_08237 [Capsaspora owczarzaki ATCC 30864]
MAAAAGRVLLLADDADASRSVSPAVLPALCFDRSAFFRPAAGPGSGPGAAGPVGVASHDSNSTQPSHPNQPGSAPPTANAATSDAGAAFHVEEFVAQCRQRVSLELLLADLQVFLASLHSELVELINRDYADFVNLSSNLVGMDKAISDIRAPLWLMREEVTNVRAVVEDSVMTVQAKLDQRAAVREKKATLTLFINVSASLEKIEKLLAPSSSTAASALAAPGAPVDESTAAITASTRLIERVASEFNQLQFYVSQGRDLPFIQNLHSRISFVTSILSASLERGFLAALDGNDRNMLTQCFRTYASMDKAYEAEALIRKHWVAPFLQQTINAVNLNSSNGLQRIFENVLTFVDDRIRPLDALVLDTGARGYDLVVNSVWPEIVHCICNNIASIFAPAIPNNFHQNFVATTAFIRQLEAKCNSVVSVKRLREHEASRQLQDKWNLSVYFQLRFHEIASELETVLQAQQQCTSSSLKRADASSKFHLLSTATMWHTITSCWSPTIYLDVLSHRMWKLTLQLISRYAGWSRQSVSDLSTHLQSALPNDTGAVADGTLQNAKNLFAIANADIQACLLVQLDVTSCIAQLPGFVSTVIEPMLQQSFSTLEQDKVANLKESFAESYGLLQSTIAPIEQVVVRALTEACTSSLAPVRGVKSVYRMTNKEMPTKPSTYVLPIFKPLAVLLSPLTSTEVSPNALPQETARRWMTQVVETVSSRLLEICQDEIATMRKREDSLSKLKRGKKSVAGGLVAEVTDTDKIIRQLQLDTDAIAEQIDELGLASSSIEQLQELRNWLATAANAPRESAE